MSDRVAAAVVGVGHLGRHHARLYAASGEADLVAVVDTDAKRAKSIAAEYGCEALTEIEALDDRVRAVSIAVPTVAHREVAERLLRSGMDVLIEKPIASTLEEADAINNIARESGRIVMVGHTERFNPAMIALAEAVDEPRFFEIHRLAGFTARSTDIDVVLDLMIHDLDLLLKFDGSDAVSVDAMGMAALTDKLDIANARIRMASGCVANITASRISAEAVRRIRVFQSRTYLSCDTAARKVERYRLTTGNGGTPSIEHDRLAVEDTEPLANEIAAFLDAVRTRETPSIDGVQGRRVLELAFRVGRSIAESMA
ncbi:MAG: Gfo/Idh/MocA family oxidoreductase [Acidobacteriota bacterium]|nr:Gfo/Idh/MocA family oxidoreductase [Acidobacteriota bacterium]